MVLESLWFRFDVGCKDILAAVFALILAFVATHVEAKRRPIFLLPPCLNFEFHQGYELRILAALTPDAKEIIFFQHGILKSVLCRFVQTAKEMRSGLWEALAEPMNYVMEKVSKNTNLFRPRPDFEEAAAAKGVDLTLSAVACRISAGPCPADRRTFHDEPRPTWETEWRVTMARNLTWTDEKSFHEPSCDNCGWVYASFAMIAEKGISREQARKAYRDKVRAEFQRHECAKHPRTPRTHGSR